MTTQTPESLDRNDALKTPLARPDKRLEWSSVDSSVEKLTEKNSTAIAPHVINLAIQEAIKHLKDKRGEEVTGIDFKDTPEAARFDASRDQYRLDLTNPSVHSLYDKCISDNFQDVNKFLASKWFNIRLQQGEPGSLYIAATFKHKIDWNNDWSPLGSGELPFKDNWQDQIKSVKMPKDRVSKFNVSTEWQNREVYAVKGANWDIVYMMNETSYNRNISQYGLDRLVRSIDNTISQSWWSQSDKDLHFPQIKYDKSQDLQWLIGTGVDVKNGPWYKIAQAKMQTQFELSPTWAQASAAVAMEARTRGLGSPVDSISWPFITWMKKGWVITFVGRMGRESMISVEKNKA